MHFLTRHAFGFFLSAGGLFGLAALESTLFFWFPFGIDAAVIIMTVRQRDHAWQFPIIAAMGSLLGTAVTYWMGRKIGESGLERYISSRTLQRAKTAVRKKGGVALALLGLVPPPFPFTGFVLTAGALEIEAARFLGTLAAVRLGRFTTEMLLAHRYGTSVLGWMKSDLVQDIVGGLIGLAIAGSLVSLIVLLRSSSHRRVRRTQGA